MKNRLVLFGVSALVFTMASCSFDYGAVGGGGDTGRPDIVMENVIFVSVEGGEPLVRFRAELAEQWEESQIMNLTFASFEQLEDNGHTVNAAGLAGSATVHIESGNVSLMDGVRISIESEDITIETETLEWNDDARILFGREHDEVSIYRSDGTRFIGVGFSANSRTRTWSFSGEVRGRYVEDENGDMEFEDFEIDWPREDAWRDTWVEAPAEPPIDIWAEIPAEEEDK